MASSPAKRILFKHSKHNLSMKASPSTAVQLYLGTMTFGWKGQTSSPVDQNMADQMVQRFASNAKDDNAVLIDTARIYAGGETEKILGNSLVKGFAGSQVKVGSKAHPRQPGGLSEKGIMNQLETSLEALGVNTLYEYYLHQPDTEHSLLESLTCLDELMKKGIIERVGMSNYAASEMERAFLLCEEHNLSKPSVYQGLYNPLNRLVEDDLLPILKKNNCSFIAYNPLAAGLLTGKHKNNGDDVPAGRFKNNQNYLPRFYTDANFEAVDVIRKSCDIAGISMVEATFKWLLHHSALDGSYKDGILIGASSMIQLESNIKACDEDELLPQNVLDAFDEAWSIMSSDSDEVFKYWRSFSSDMPNRDMLDHGASYNANKVEKK